MNEYMFIHSDIDTLISNTLAHKSSLSCVVLNTL